MAIPLTLQPSKPSWLRIKPGRGIAFGQVTNTINTLGLTTVCEEAKCPNLTECWSSGTATFMVLGDVCTRGCRFCAVKTKAKGTPVDPNEPYKIAEAVSAFELDYVVITSVDRDDLPDQGASHFAECIREIKQQNAGILVEVLTPDFRGNMGCTQTVLDAKPDMYAHNIETVKRLQKKVRDPRADYEQSLSILEYVKRESPQTYTKSSIMVGLGETKEEVVETLDDLRAVGCDAVTLGQYLRPTMLHLPVQEYVSPAVFEWFKRKALEKGFLYCASGPFVRSSYRAGEFFIKSLIEKNRGQEHGEKNSI